MDLKHTRKTSPLLPWLTYPEVHLRFTGPWAQPFLEPYYLIEMKVTVSENKTEVNFKIVLVNNMG